MLGLPILIRLPQYLVFIINRMFLRIPVIGERTKLPPYPRNRNRFYRKPLRMDVPKNLVPDGTVPLENQVAGHTFQAGTDAIGMLKNKQGIVLKPGGKPVCAAREIQFYKTIQDSQDPHMVTMRQLVPEFHGSLAITIEGRDVSI